jgi:hypothetical protein
MFPIPSSPHPPCASSIAAFIRVSPSNRLHVAARSRSEEVRAVGPTRRTHVEELLDEASHKAAKDN